MKGELVVVDVHDLAQGGDGVGRLDDGRVIFVPRVFPGERVRVRVTQAKKSFARGTLVELLTPLPERGESGCEHFDTCGGCAFWEVPYPVEFALKTRAALEAMKRIGGWTDTPPVGLHPAESPEGYRERANLHAVKVRGAWVVGFYERASRHVVPVPGCPVLHPELADAVTSVASFIPGQLRHADILVETDGDGGWTATGDVMTDDTATIRAECAVHRAPAGLRVPAGRFRQSGRRTNATLVEATMPHLKGSRNVLELFCGMGNFSRSVVELPGVNRLHGVEADEMAVAAAQEIVGSGATFSVAELPASLHELREMARWDTILLDPPRTGALEVCDAIATWDEVERIVYVACEPTRFARDAARLAESGWNISALELVDMFPRTPHVEVVACLRRT